MTGFINRVLVKVGGKDLDLVSGFAFDLIQHLSQHDGHGIGFLPRGTPRNPYPHGVIQHPVLQEHGDGLCLQGLKGVSIPEEISHPDQQLLEEQIEFMGILLKKTDIQGNLVDLMDAHASFNAAGEHILFIKEKIITRMGSQQDANLLQGA